MKIKGTYKTAAEKSQAINRLIKNFDKSFCGEEMQGKRIKIVVNYSAKKGDTEVLSGREITLKDDCTYPKIHVYYRVKNEFSDIINLVEIDTANDEIDWRDMSFDVSEIEGWKSILS